MTIDQIRECCTDDYVQAVMFEYKWFLKEGEPFDIEWIDSKNQWWIQYFDSDGFPKGKALPLK